ncbi:MAG TPA: sigma-54 dependent transcriptional regulator, partial [Candidatus Acidoferrum sp.]|nr:sigma-54 dependent transcriptional regulator [Candidatus Acidoferrum sp.]
EMLALLQEQLEAEGHRVVAVQEGAQALDRLQAEPFDLVLTDLKMPGVDGMEVLRRVRESARDVPVILITAFGSIETAIQAMRQGAYDYVTKPFSLEEISLLVGKALETRRLRAENVRLQQELEGHYRFETLLGKSAAMQAVFALIRRVAGGESNVLITGATGTGKELVARAIHFNSPRAKGPFLPVNCAAIPEGLLESELFGHVKGAFTGAVSAHRGLFQVAAGGTLFLDEISAMPSALQAKVLRAIQEREVRPVGGSEVSQVDLRLVAASNRDLKAMVTAGEFREDLYYRLAVIPIHLPPLCERVEDIPLLAEAFLRKYAAPAGRSIRGFSPEAMAQLLTHPWPGNVRELENVVERAVNLCSHEEISPEDLGLDAGVAGTGFILRGLGPRPTLDALIQAYTAATLEQLQNDKEQAARVLGISKRTLYRWLQKHDGEDDKTTTPVTS